MARQWEQNGASFLEGRFDFLARRPIGLLMNNVVSQRVDVGGFKRL